MSLLDRGDSIAGKPEGVAVIEGDARSGGHVDAGSSLRHLSFPDIIGLEIFSGLPGLLLRAAGR
jgi:hypothetical protein